jgi:hypothetical protein
MVRCDASICPGLNGLAVSRLYEPIRSDPRIQAIIKRVKLK